MTFEQALEFIKVASSSGVREVKWDGIELSFKGRPKVTAAFIEPALTNDPLFMQNIRNNLENKPEIKEEELVKPMSPFDGMTEEEILYYATPYYDEIQAQKEAHAQKLAEEGAI